MTKRLLVDWHLRTKFVEILPRNSICLFNVAVSRIHKLNPGKCKEMVINFMKNSNFLLGLIVVGSTLIQRVTSYRSVYRR